MLIPANSPNVAVAKSKKGLILIKRETAESHKAAQFRFEESVYAGFDDDLTYRIRPVGSDSIVLGNNDSSDNNARIVSEAIDTENRGQYWISSNAFSWSPNSP